MTTFDIYPIGEYYPIKVIASRQYSKKAFTQACITGEFKSFRFELAPDQEYWQHTWRELLKHADLFSAGSLNSQPDWHIQSRSSNMDFVLHRNWKGKRTITVNTWSQYRQVKENEIKKAY